MDRSVTLYDWPLTYKPDAWHLPAYKKYDPDAGEFRNLFINWSELVQAGDAGSDAPMWSVYCDVLRLDGNASIDRTAMIFARRIELGGDFSLVVDRTEGEDTAALTIYAQEVINYKTGFPAGLNVTEVAPEASVKTVTFQPVNGRIAGLVWWPGRNAVLGDLARIPLQAAFLTEGNPLRLLLTTTFQVATLLCTTQPRLSIAQLQWIETMASANADTLDLSLQAGAMASNLILQQGAGDAVLVPFLDSSVYAESAKNLMTLLRHRDGAWTALKNLVATNALWQQVIEDSIGDKADQNMLTGQLQQQADESRSQAWLARSIAARLIVEQKSALEACRNDFDRGIKEWEQKMILKGVFDMVTGIVQLLIEIPTIVAAGPAFAATTLSSASDVLKGLGSIVGAAADTILTYVDASRGPANGPVSPGAVAEVNAEEQAAREKSAKKLKRSMANAGSAGASAVAAAMKIYQVTAQAAAMEAASTQILGTIGKTLDQSFATIEVKGLDVVTGGSQEWENLGIEIEQLFENIPDLGQISGGNAYRLEFRKLIVKGKALSEARLAVARANSQLAEMKLRALVAEKSLKRSRDRMAGMMEKKQVDELLQQYAFNKVLDAKRSVYMALESYRRAFIYFTLEEDGNVPKLPSLLDSVDAFQKTVSTIAGKELTLSAAFKSRQPQDIEKEISIDEPSAIAALQERGSVTWTLRYNDPHFRNLSRIRFTELSVIVAFREGYQYDKEISVRILSSGQYADKNKRQKEQVFVAAPMEKNFEYRELNGSRKVSVRANILTRFAADFFNPTPFSTWHFSFNEPAFDMKQVSGLKVTFKGDALSI